MVCHDRPFIRVLATGPHRSCKRTQRFLYQEGTFSVHKNAVWFGGGACFFLPINVYCLGRSSVNDMYLLHRRFGNIRPHRTRAVRTLRHGLLTSAQGWTETQTKQVCFVPYRSRVFGPPHNSRWNSASPAKTRGNTGLANTSLYTGRPCILRAFFILS